MRTHYNPDRSGRSWSARLKHKGCFLSNGSTPWFQKMFYKRQISSHRCRHTLPNTRLTFRCVPVDERVHQRPAFAIVSGSKLEPVSFQGTHHLTFPGNAHGECPLVVLWDQRVQWSKTWSPRMEEHEELQAWLNGGRDARRRNEKSHEEGTVVSQKAMHLTTFVLVQK